MGKDIVGTFVLEKNDNMDEYLAAVGVPYLVRIMILKSSPSLTIERSDDGVWRIERKSALSSGLVEFRLGEEFTETMKSGIATKCVARLDGDKLVMDCATGEIEEERTLELKEGDDDVLIQTMCIKGKGLTAVRTYKRSG